MKEEKGTGLEKELYNKSFKIKPLLLELPNYEFFHTSIRDKDNDTNERFLGRSKIIDKLLSFVKETSKNTGTYLITGFRGMGKTSVVNKALSKLNPLQKSGSFILLWLLLLPYIIFARRIALFFEDFKPSDYNTLFLIYLLFSVFIISILGNFNNRIKKTKLLRDNRLIHPAILATLILSIIYLYELDLDSFYLLLRSLGLVILIITFIYLTIKLVSENIKTNILQSLDIFFRFQSGFESILNPNFKKSKYSFLRVLRSLWIYTSISCLLVFMIHIYHEELGSFYLSHYIFWLVTFSLIFSYLVFRTYDSFIRYYKKEKKAFKRTNWGIIISILVAIIVFILFEYGYFQLHKWYVESIESKLLYGSIIIFSILISYVVIKTLLHSNYYKSDKVTDKRSIYKSLLGRFTSFFNFQHFLVVRVNLGKDQLTEKDVLKYCTNELYREYSNWYSNFKNFKRLINIVGLLSLMYLTYTFVYKGFLGTGFSQFSARTVNLSLYFPSQALLTNNNNLNIEDVYNLFYKNKESKDEVNLKQYLNSIDTIANYQIDTTANSQNEKGKLIKREDPLKIGYLDYVRTKKNDAYTWASDLNRGVMLVCNEIDYLILKVWIKTKKLLVANHFEKPNSTAPALINLVFPNVPIYFIYGLMFLSVLSLRFIPKRLQIIRLHSFSLRELKEIKRQIDASITFEESANAATLKSSWFNFRKRTSYSPLEAKDITQKLIHLLDKINAISSIFTKVHFIFVFDELDKINPHSAVVINSKEDEFDMENNEVRYQARRKERIANILASMKHFLNSAKAKFIFIAGREMYDAALAGISDRESSLDSIFNDNKIYINSFYTEEEDKNKNDITSITEQYLCQFLIPDWYLSRQSEKPCLNLYNKYLKDEYNNLRPQSYCDKKREKIITSLKDYVVYLAYRSNGAPRKLSNLIERNVRPISVNDLEDSGKIVVGVNNDNLYINIGFYDQYKFSLISSLTTPVFLSIGNFLHEYSDKLLVSISYMLDHLYKFHKFGISYRSLSLTPEIVDVNKEPQFREFLDKLVHSLSKNHLRPIVSGIYDYKFHSKIAAEIKFLSKIDDLEGAALNFTLDESIELKRYFNRRLEQFKERDRDKAIAIKNDHRVNADHHINNIGLLHVMIGDLHFYDEEYQDAISHYLDSIQNLRQKDIKDMVLYDFVLFVRNKLKLALAFEKNKMYDNAFMTYSELTDLIIRKRNIPIRKFGLARFIISKKKITDNTWLKLKDSITNSEKLDKVINQYKANKDIVVLGRLKDDILKKMEAQGNENDFYQWKKLYPIEDMAVFYGKSSDDIISDLGEIDTNYKNLKYFFTQSTGENIRILYQPLIAKLHLIEKSSPDKLKDIDIVRAIKEFNFLKLPLKTAEKRVIVSEFYNKIGDLLYFKNGTLNKYLKKEILDQLDSIPEKKEKSKETKNLNKPLKNLLLSPIDATYFYIKSLAVLLTPIREHEKKEKSDEIIDLIGYYTNRDLSSKTSFSKSIELNLEKIINNLEKITSNNTFRERYSHEYLTSIANGAIDLAETLSSFVKEGHTYKKLFGDTKETYVSINMFIEILSKDLKKIISLYYQAYQIYKGVGAYRLAKSQLLKILHVLREHSNNSEGDSSASKKSLNVLLDSLEKIEIVNMESIVEKAMECVFFTYDLSHFVEGQKIDEIFSSKESETPSLDIKKTTAAGEINEIILLKWKLDLNLIKKSNISGLLELYLNAQKNIHSYSMIRRKNNRLMELRYKICLNKKVFELLECQNRKDQVLEAISETKEIFNENITSIEELKKFIIIDSIGANNELLKSHYLFGIDYVTTNHNQLAKAHYSMGYWCKQLRKIMACKTVKGILKKHILNTRNLMNLTPEYHYNRSLDYNYRSINFHSKGEPLSVFLKTSSYLDDFYNDSLIHFSIAIERNIVQETNKGIDHFVEKIKDELKSEEYKKFFRMDNYV